MPIVKYYTAQVCLAQGIAVPCLLLIRWFNIYMKMTFRLQMTKNHHMLNSLTQNRNWLIVKAKRRHIFWTNAYKNGHCGQAGNVLWVHAELFFCTFDGYFCILYVCSQLELCQGHLREQSTRIKTFSVSLMINMFDIELKCIFLQKKSVS